MSWSRQTACLPSEDPPHDDRRGGHHRPTQHPCLSAQARAAPAHRARAGDCRARAVGLQRTAPARVGAGRRGARRDRARGGGTLRPRATRASGSTTIIPSNGASPTCRAGVPVAGASTARSASAATTRTACTPSTPATTRSSTRPWASSSPSTATLEKGSWLDYGMFLEAIMVGARQFGLETCPQAAWLSYYDILQRRLFYSCPTQTVVCGMALGYPDPDEKVNTFTPDRMPAGGVRDLGGTAAGLSGLPGRESGWNHGNHGGWKSGLEGTIRHTRDAGCASGSDPKATMQHTGSMLKQPSGCRHPASPNAMLKHRRQAPRDRRLHDRPALAARVTTSSSSWSNVSSVPSPVLPEAMAASRASFEG